MSKCESPHILIFVFQENADPVICRRVLSCNGYDEVCALLQYYQMEVRWPIRQLLIKAFCVMCSVHPPVIPILLNSVLPMELARSGSKYSRLSIAHSQKNKEVRSQSLQGCFEKTSFRCQDFTQLNFFNFS